MLRARFTTKEVQALEFDTCSLYIDMITSILCAAFYTFIM